MNKSAFSVREIIIVSFIILMILVVIFSFMWAKKQNVINYKTTSDLQNLSNSINNYLSENNSLPEILWNRNYFDENWDYSEYESFWINWFTGNNFLDKKYIEKIPVDTRINQFYAYWKTNDEKSFQVAWVVNIEWIFVTKVEWNYDYTKNKLIWLIREYNWPNFVYNDSHVFFPYNPTEKKLIAKINNYDWKLEIISKLWKIINTKEEILNYKLTEWDSIHTWYSTQATIFFSDWSISVLEENSKLLLENMQYLKKDSIITKIKLFLESWIIWTEATKINSSSSDFEIYTDDTTAAVRWTIFAVKYRKWKTSITTKSWEVKAKSNTSEQIIKTWNFIWTKIKFKKFKINKKIITANLETWEIIVKGFEK